MPKSRPLITLATSTTGVDHQVVAQVSPLVESSPQIGLALPVERIDAVECQFVIHAHLVPGDLVDHHHRPFATEPIEDRPQPFRRLLLIERGDLCHL